jgi:hypothetical protein
MQTRIPHEWPAQAPRAVVIGAVWAALPRPCGWAPRATGDRRRPAGHARRARVVDHRERPSLRPRPHHRDRAAGLRELWAACGRDFDADVDLRPLDPFYEIRWPTGPPSPPAGHRGDARRGRAAVARDDLAGYDKFLKDSERRYWFGFEDLGRRPMNRLADLVKVLPTFGMLRADKSVYAHAASR